MHKGANNSCSVPKQFGTSTFQQSGEKRHRSQTPRLAVLFGNCTCEEQEGRITQLLVLYRRKLALCVLWSCLYLRSRKTAPAAPSLRHCKFIKPISSRYVHVREQTLWLCRATRRMRNAAVGAHTSQSAQLCCMLSR